MSSCPNGDVISSSTYYERGQIKWKEQPKLVPLVFTPTKSNKLHDVPEQVASVGGDKLGTGETRNLESRRIFGGHRQ